MNETNELNRLEAQLRCWMPRRPSATLERRLFPQVTPRAALAMVAGWLAPVAACLMFAGLILNPQNAGISSGSPPSSGIVGLILSNQNYAAYLPGSFQRTHNQLEAFSRTAGDGFFSETNLIR